MQKSRPIPPAVLLDMNAAGFRWDFTVAAPEIGEWVEAHLLNESSKLYNEDHKHLAAAHIGYLWTNAGWVKQGRTVVGTAEVPMFRCGGFQKARLEQQIIQWFGDIPDFIITIQADYAAVANEAEWCALIEHELYHCGQDRDEFGEPKFRRDGRPVLGMRGHDCEEFVGVVRRYGIGSAAGGAAQLVEAAKIPAEIARVDIARSCGTCLLKAA